MIWEYWILYLDDTKYKNDMFYFRNDLSFDFNFRVIEKSDTKLGAL